ncbi:hypothetical protein BTW14_gp155 [BeAn 58058 virus]|uniref:hypothetical protein n=1 Tax=BeAn 58058 virus TaxID=67082 RepID=UPI00090AC539|nr:hypothetical protein BTW14_gp155 [BeAn 58058 virus]APG58346.1 hypothetical protein BAV00169 [BeAn 58058 virus]
MDSGSIFVTIVTIIIAIILFGYGVSICLCYSIPLLYKKESKDKMIKLNQMYFGTLDNKKSIQYVTSYEETDDYNQDEFIEDNE